MKSFLTLAVLAAVAASIDPIGQIDSAIDMTMDTTKDVVGNTTEAVGGKKDTKKIDEPMMEEDADIDEVEPEVVGEPMEDDEFAEEGEIVDAVGGKKDKKKKDEVVEETTEFDFTKLFEKGFCPENIEGMKDIEYAKLSGDWFLQRMDEPFVPEMLPRCHHCQLDVDEMGSFSATEEVQFGGRNFIVNEIQGEFNGSTLEAEFFGEKMQVSFEILATDYDNYMIGYECFDNMEFSMESEGEIEPVHIITLGIATRNPNETKEVVTKLEEQTLELLPFLTQEDFAVIEQGEAAECEYKLEF